MNLNNNALAGMIDSTLLNSDCTGDDITRLCSYADEHGLFAVCVPPSFVSHSFQCLQDSPVRIVSVVSFPYGSDSTYTKCMQAEQIVKEGADEIDLVMNIDEFLQENYKTVSNDIRNTVIAAKSQNMRRFLTDVTVVKVIIETAQLRQAEKDQNRETGELIRKASEIVADAQADFVKTSTGLHPAGGVRDNDVSLIKSAIPASVGVKAAGGIKTLKHCENLIKESVDRIGTSSAAAILSGFDGEAG